MKKSIIVSIFFTLLFTFTNTALGQEGHLRIKDVLRNAAILSLDSVAEQSGKRRVGSSSIFSYAKSNLVVYLPVYLPFPLIALKAKFLLPLAIVGPPVGHDWIELFRSRRKALPMGSAYVPVNSHYRVEIHYELSPLSTESLRALSWPEKGSCMLFFSLNIEEENLLESIEYEIDRCKHESIFPQAVEGKLRVGDKINFHDEVMGQTLVVARGTLFFLDTEEEATYALPLIQAEQGEDYHCTLMKTGRLLFSSENAVRCERIPKEI